MPRPVHTTKMFNGEAVEDVHQRLSFPAGAKCQTCSRPPAVGAISYASWKDASERYPELAELPTESIGPLLIRLRLSADGSLTPCIRLGRTYSCKQHRADFEKALARQPSWVLVELQEGPKASKFLSGSRGGSLV